MGLLIDETRDALDAAAASQSPNRGLSDPQDRFLEGLLGVSLGASHGHPFRFPFAFAIPCPITYASACHVCDSSVSVKNLKFLNNRGFYSPIFGK